MVLDTKLVLSALVFNTGTLVALRRGWQSQRFTPLVSKATAGELIRVLAYPKFRLNAEEREHLLSDYLPCCETVQVPNPPPPTPTCRDPFDVPFLALALAGKADLLVTGDQYLPNLASEFPCPIVNAESLLKHFEPTGPSYTAAHAQGHARRRRQALEPRQRPQGRPPAEGERSARPCVVSHAL